MTSRDLIGATAERVFETEQAIHEQRRYRDSLADPALKAIASRTLTTLEEMLVIMQRTRGLLADRNER